MKTLRKLYFWAAIYTFVPIMIIALAMICFKSWMMLILIFGGLYVCGMVPRSVNLLKCARLMKSMDMLVLADKEYPNEGSLAYYISGHFVWGIENHSVVPLESIASVQIAGRNYVNSMKGKATLVLITKENKRIYLLHYSGLSLDAGLSEIEICISALRKRIPNLQLK